MEDHFSSIRFLLISALIVMVGVIIASMVGMDIQEESKGMAKPTFLFLVAFYLDRKTFLLCSVHRLFWSPDRHLPGFRFHQSGTGFKNIEQTALAAHLSGFGDQCKIFSRCGHHRYCVGRHCPYHLRPRHSIDRSGARFGRSLASCDLPYHQHPLYLLLVGDIDPLLRRLSEHRHLCSGLFGRVDIFLLLR